MKSLENVGEKEEDATETQPNKKQQKTKVKSQMQMRSERKRQKHLKCNAAENGAQQVLEGGRGSFKGDTARV